jgi:hypothetical protein
MGQDPGPFVMSMQPQPSGFRLVFRTNWQKSEGCRNRAQQADQSSAQSRIGRGGIGRTLPVAAPAGCGFVFPAVPRPAGRPVVARVEAPEDALCDQFESLDVVAFEGVEHQSPHGRHMPRCHIREEGESLVCQVREGEPALSGLRRRLIHPRVSIRSTVCVSRDGVELARVARSPMGRVRPSDSDRTLTKYSK